MFKVLRVKVLIFGKYSVSYLGNMESKDMGILLSSDRLYESIKKKSLVHLIFPGSHIIKLSPLLKLICVTL